MADLLNHETQHLPYVKVGDSKYLSNMKDTISLKGRQSFSYHTSQSNLSNVFTSDTQVDFEIAPSSSVHCIKDIVLELNVINNGASAVTALPTPFLLNRVDIKVGSSLIDQIFPEECYFEMLMNHPSDYITSHANEWNVDSADYDVAAAIGAGATNTWQVPLSCFLNTGDILIRALRSKIRFECHFRSGSAIVASTSVGAGSDLGLQNCRLRLGGWKFDPPVLADLLNRYEKAPHVSSAVVRRRDRLTFSGATSGVTSDQQLGALTGSFANLRFIVRPLSASQENRIAGVNLNNVTLLDSSGSPVNYNQVPASYIRKQIIPNNYPTDLMAKTTSNANIFEIPFSEAPLRTFEGGFKGGVQRLNGLYQLSLEFASSSNYEAYCIAYEYVNVIVQNGDMAVRFL